MQNNSDISTVQILIDIWRVLNRKRKRQFSLMFILIFISGFFETFSLASIIPLINFLISPDKLMDNSLISSASDFLRINNPQKLIFQSLYFYMQ